MHTKYCSIQGTCPTSYRYIFYPCKYLHQTANTQQGPLNRPAQSGFPASLFPKCKSSFFNIPAVATYKQFEISRFIDPSQVVIKKFQIFYGKVEFNFPGFSFFQEDF